MLCYPGIGWYAAVAADANYASTCRPTVPGSSHGSRESRGCRNHRRSAVDSSPARCHGDDTAVEFRCGRALSIADRSAWPTTSWLGGAALTRKARRKRAIGERFARCMEWHGDICLDSERLHRSRPQRPPNSQHPRDGNAGKMTAFLAVIPPRPAWRSRFTGNRPASAGGIRRNLSEATRRSSLSQRLRREGSPNNGQPQKPMANMSDEVSHRMKKFKDMNSDVT